MLKSFVLNRFAPGLSRSNTLQPLGTIVPPPRAAQPLDTPQTARAPQSSQPTPAAALSAVASDRPRSSPHLCGSLRSFMLVMLTSQHGFLAHPLGSHREPVVNLTYRQLCAQAVVLLERMDSEIMRRMSHHRLDEPPYWTPQLLLMVVFRLILRVADDGGSLHHLDSYSRLRHRDSYLQLRHSVVVAPPPNFAKGAFLRHQELRFLESIGFATYVSPQLIDATLERMNRWLSVSRPTLRKRVFKHPEACVIGPLLAEHLGWEARIMRLAIEERDQCQRMSSPKSPPMPTTPTMPRFRAVPEMEGLLSRTQAKTADGQAGDFDPLPPMPQEMLPEFEDMGCFYGTR